MVKANASGVYSHAWSIAVGIVTKITIGVYPDYPNISGTYTPPGGVGHPPHNFRITGPGNPIIMLGSTYRTLNLTGSKTIDVTLSASEVGNAFLTAAEVYAMHAAQTLPPSGSILAKMNNVNIYANGQYATNFAPLDSVVQLMPNTATNQPFTVAHEFGYIVNWKSFNLTNAAYSTDAYTACFSGFGWGGTTDECEMVAWAEGFATMQAAMWMWTRSASTPSIPRITTPTGVNMETSASTQCPANAGHTRPICNAFAMWDVIDRPTGDDDTIDQGIDLGHVIHVLRTYPTCTSTITNRCIHENDLANGMNWRDYRHNHVLMWGEGADMTGIQGTNQINSSDNN